MTILAHISDLHFGRENPLIVDSLVASLEEVKPRLVIVSGDLTQRARRGEFLAARTFLNRLRTPYLVIPGNHDMAIYNIFERFSEPWKPWYLHIGDELEPVMRDDSYLAVGVNTTRRWSSLFNWSRGRISEDQVGSICRQVMGEEDERLRLVIAHHPFWLPEDYEHRHLIAGRDMAIAGFREAGIDMILSGHIHDAYTRLLSGIIVSHAGTAVSTRLRNESPNSYKLICGDRHRLEIQTMAWNGATFAVSEQSTFIHQDGWKEAAASGSAGKSRDTVTESANKAKMPGRIKSPVLVYYNPKAGTASQVLEQLQGDVRVQMEAATPAGMADIVKKAVQRKSDRIIVCGGDGTIALAASHLAGSTTELAVIPGGTLNHFAKRVGIPGDIGEALDTALNGMAYPVDVGYVNDRLFINTSSVGAYAVFVRSREYLQHRMGYIAASIIAGFRRLLRLRSAYVTIEGKELKTSLVFIGVGERDLRLPLLGQPKDQGRKGLHMIALSSSNRLEMLALLGKSVFLGVDPLAKGRHVETMILERAELNFHRRKRRVHVALDGELIWLKAPLEYHFAPGKIRIVSS